MRTSSSRTVNSSSSRLSRRSSSSEAITPLTYVAMDALVPAGVTVLPLPTRPTAPSSTPSSPVALTPGVAPQSSTAVSRSSPSCHLVIGCGPLSGCCPRTTHMALGLALVRSILPNLAVTIPVMLRVAGTLSRALCTLVPTPTITAGGATTSSARRYTPHTPPVTTLSALR